MIRSSGTWRADAGAVRTCRCGSAAGTRARSRFSVPRAVYRATPMGRADPRRPDREVDPAATPSGTASAAVDGAPRRTVAHIAAIHDRRPNEACTWRWVLRFFECRDDTEAGLLVDTAAGAGSPRLTSMRVPSPSATRARHPRRGIDSCPRSWSPLPPVLTRVCWKAQSAEAHDMLPGPRAPPETRVLEDATPRLRRAIEIRTRDPRGEDPHARPRHGRDNPDRCRLFNAALSYLPARR